ncbi:guanylate kinase [Roseomonas sp. SSH11]|uniref:Guanylate kinase n=1 Tax=Pararoseomonas baculiformis TaxID=2820812 RepID=A0ABS4AI03_9PROT|nr:guanylate kinase [Pararoseomonas baculiformis]MBP0446626.1 guanylate kinase [Pararoseomonas baculiformis]
MTEMKRRGLCLVLVAPSGAGKTSVSRALLAGQKELSLSISATTRAARPGEVHGVHYFFHSPEEFEAMEARGHFLESAHVYGRRYGTPRAPVEAALAEGRDVLFDVDWQGHRLLQESMPGDVVGVFLMPPSIAELERRLRARGQDSEEEIVRRMGKAREDASHWRDFDHVLINADFPETVETVAAILRAARTARSRNLWLGDFVAGLG